MLSGQYNLPDLSNANSQEAVSFIIPFLKKAIPHSSTKLSLAAIGHPQTSNIETTIRANQKKYPKPLEAALAALETGCGNCQELAYAGALILRLAGYKGNIAIGQYGINHQFLFIDDLLADPWADLSCSKEAWKGKLKAYGGSIRNGIMYGRLLSSDHEELEDEKPEVVEEISAENVLKVLLPKIEKPLQMAFQMLLFNHEVKGVDLIESKPISRSETNKENNDPPSANTQ